MSRVAEATQAAQEHLASVECDNETWGMRPGIAARQAAEAYEQGIIEPISDAYTSLLRVRTRLRTHLGSLPGVVSSSQRTRVLSDIAALEAALACLRTALKGTPRERLEAD